MVWERQRRKETREVENEKSDLDWGVIEGFGEGRGRAASMGIWDGGNSERHGDGDWSLGA